jgi:CelD/BcsL family acetyltransferase involved in cellulose biosynthesis
VDGLTLPPQSEWVTDLDRFAELRERWNPLAEASPFLTWEWLDAWWRSFGERAGMRVHVAWDGRELAGGMACGLDRRHLTAMANRETDLYRPLIRSTDDLETVVGPIVSGPWSRITIPALPIGDVATVSLTAALRSEGWLIDETFREACAIVDTTGSFDEYFMGLSSKARSNLRRGRRHLEDAGTLEIRVVEPLVDPEPVLSEALGLEAAGWKGDARSATLFSERATRFWRSLSQHLQRSGALRLSELRLDGALIAFSLAIQHGGRVYRMKTSYDERYSSFSPGNVLLIEMIAHAFETEIEAIEMLGPMLDSKQRYATDARETMILRAYRRRPASALRYAGRRQLVPRLRPGYVRARRALDRARGRRQAAPGQSARAR